MPSAARKRAPRRDHAAIARAWAESVLDGSFPCGKYVKLAVRRQVRDLAREDTDAFPYIFNEDAGARRCRFLERLPHVDGPLAGELVTLEPWQCWGIIVHYGWETRKGFPRFRHARYFMPKGNGKTFLGAGLALDDLGNGGKGQKVYSAATVKDQARLSWVTAQQMMRKRPELRDRLGLRVGEHAITQPSTGGLFIPLSSEAKTLEGKIPSFILEDEIHAHPTRETHDNLRSSMAKRPDSRMVIISTAGMDTTEESIGFELYSDCRAILEGEVEDESVFAMLHEADEFVLGPDLRPVLAETEDGKVEPVRTDPYVEETWRAANPNYGVSIDPSEVKNEAMEAKRDPRKRKSFFTKRLGWWVSGKDPYFVMEEWDACANAPPPESLGSMPCRLGLDLASSLNFASCVRLFEEDKPHRDPVRAKDGETERHFYLYVENFLHEAAVESREMFGHWQRDKQIIVTPGSTTDYSFILKRVEGHLAAHNILEIVSDPYESAQLAQRADENARRQLTFVEYGQNTKNLSPALKEMFEAVRSGRLHHDGNKSMRWMVGNVVAKEDPNSNVFPLKARRDLFIDGVSATLNAIGRSMVSPPKKRSVYETRGLVVLGGKTNEEDEAPEPDPLARFRDVRFDSDDF